MLTPADARRRWYGACFLIMAGLQLAWGMTLLRDYLVQRPVLFVFYWLGCFALTGMAFLVAMLDLFVMRRRTRDEQQKLVEKSFQDSQAKANQKDLPAGH